MPVGVSGILEGLSMRRVTEAQGGDVAKVFAAAASWRQELGPRPKGYAESNRWAAIKGILDFFADYDSQPSWASLVKDVNDRLWELNVGKAECQEILSRLGIPERKGAIDEAAQKCSTCGCKSCATCKCKDCKCPDCAKFRENRGDSDGDGVPNGLDEADLSGLDAELLAEAEELVDEQLASLLGEESKWAQDHPGQKHYWGKWAYKNKDSHADATAAHDDEMHQEAHSKGYVGGQHRAALADHLKADKSLRHHNVKHKVAQAEHDKAHEAFVKSGSDADYQKLMQAKKNAAAAKEKAQGAFNDSVAKFRKKTGLREDVEAEDVLTLELLREGDEITAVLAELGAEFDLGEELCEAYRQVMRDGELVKVKVRTRKAKLTPGQRRALAKARAKAHSSAAQKHRARSLKAGRQRGLYDDGD